MLWVSGSGFGSVYSPNQERTWLPSCLFFQCVLVLYVEDFMTGVLGRFITGRCGFCSPSSKTWIVLYSYQAYSYLVWEVGCCQYSLITRAKPHAVCIGFCTIGVGFMKDPLSKSRHGPQEPPSLPPCNPFISSRSPVHKPYIPKPKNLNP